MSTTVINALSEGVKSLKPTDYRNAQEIANGLVTLRRVIKAKLAEVGLEYNLEIYLGDTGETLNVEEPWDNSNCEWDTSGCYDEYDRPMTSQGFKRGDWVSSSALC